MVPHHLVVDVHDGVHAIGRCAEVGHHAAPVVLEAAKVVLRLARKVPKVLRLQEAVAQGIDARRPVGRRVRWARAPNLAIMVAALERRRHGVAIRHEGALTESKARDPPGIRVVQVELDGVHGLHGVNRALEDFGHPEAGRVAQDLEQRILRDRDDDAARGRRHEASLGLREREARARGCTRAELLELDQRTLEEHAHAAGRDDVVQALDEGAIPNPMTLRVDDHLA